MHPGSPKESCGQLVKSASVDRVGGQHESYPGALPDPHIASVCSSYQTHSLAPSLSTQPLLSVRATEPLDETGYSFAE